MTTEQRWIKRKELVDKIKETQECLEKTRRAQNVPWDHDRVHIHDSRRGVKIFLTETGTALLYTLVIAETEKKLRLLDEEFATL
jgi:hypothetical protein